jgi:C_GCAxxG_C_C family probable redox protein
MGLMCGAVTGAIVALGFIEDNAKSEAEARDDVARAVRELIRRFEARHGSSLCRELLGEDMSTESGAKRIKEEKLTAKLCPEFVRDVSEVLSEFLRT